MGDFTWMANGTLHKWLTPYTTRLATPSEQDDVWDCLLSGALRIYTRRNGLGVSFQPVRILHEMTGQPLPSGLGRPGATGHFGEKVGTSA